jgi:hypothetical protein
MNTDIEVNVPQFVLDNISENDNLNEVFFWDENIKYLKILLLKNRPDREIYIKRDLYDLMDRWISVHGVMDYITHEDIDDILTNHYRIHPLDKKITTLSHMNNTFIDDTLGYMGLVPGFRDNAPRYDQWHRRLRTEQEFANTEPWRERDCLAPSKVQMFENPEQEVDYSIKTQWF